MTIALKLLSYAALPLALCLALVPALAQTRQTPRQAAENLLKRKVPVDSVQACSLITRADIEKISLKTYSDPTWSGQHDAK